MEPGFEKKIFKAAVIDTDEIVKAQAKDIGDARMTESKEDRSENRFTRGLKRIWKHNLAQEWYRQREISRAKKDILESGNIYVGEKDFDPDQENLGKADETASKEAMDAIIERFVSEYEDEEILRDGESRETVEGKEINTKIKDLVKLYAVSSMSTDSFNEEKKRILSFYDKKMASEKSLYADNILDIANEVRDSINHGAKLNELDFEIELTLGKARQSLSTEAHQTSFDSCVEKLQNSKVGKYIANEPVALGIAAGLFEVGRNVLQKSVTGGARWALFGLGAVAAGGISAMKERARVTRERAQHQRESAKGMKFNESDMKRRKEMEQYSYDTKKATIIIENLNTDISKIKEGKVLEQEVNEIIGRLADLQSRIDINQEEKIDLIVYDKFSTVEKDRTAIDLKSAELKKLLRNSSDGVNDFDDRLDKMVGAQTDQLMKSEHGGIEQKDEDFRKFKNKRALKAFAKTTLVAGTFGFVTQEVGAVFNSSKDGVVEGGIKHLTGKEDLVKHGTALEALRRYITGDHTMMPKTNLDEEMFGDTSVKLPEGVTFEENPDNTYNLLRNGEVISKDISMTPDDWGNLSEETREALAKSGVTAQFNLLEEKTTETIHESADDYVKNHAENMQQVRRHDFFDNDTKAFDKGELKLDWGGENGTGVDAKGNYVFNISRMTAASSYHDGINLNVPEEINKGNIKMQFSVTRGTQHMVFFVDVDPATKDVVIDPNSQLGKLMFVNNNGHADFTGGLAEVVHVKGIASDGITDVDVIATHPGEGKDMIDDVVEKGANKPELIFNIPDKNTYDVPPVLPFTGRRPLERGEYKKNREVEANRPRKQIDQTETLINKSENTGTTTEDGNKRSEREKGSLLVGGLRIGKSENIKYSPEKKSFEGREEKISKDSDHIYGFIGLNNKEIGDKLKEVKKDKAPEVLIFETSRTKRESNLKQIKNLSKYHPKIKFGYVPLPKNIVNLKEKGIKDYSEMRFENILKNSKIEKKVKRELHIGDKSKNKPLGPVSEKEWDKFVADGEVSKSRLQSIADKIKKDGMGSLSRQELDMRGEYNEEVEKLLKK